MRRSVSSPGRGSGPWSRLAVDPEPLIARLRIEGAILEPQEIFEITRLLDLAAEVRGIVASAEDRYPRLAAYASSIADLRPIARELSGKILPDGSLADDASVALARLRRDQERQKRSIEDSLARFLKAHHEAEVQLRSMLKRGENPNVRHFLARTLLDQAEVFRLKKDQGQRAGQALDAALRIWDDLARTFPHTPFYREFRALAIPGGGPGAGGRPRLVQPSGGSAEAGSETGLSRGRSRVGQWKT